MSKKQTAISVDVVNPVHALLTNKQYNARTAYYLGKAKMEKVDFDNYLYNAIKRYIESGDATHLNNAIMGGRNVSRLNQTLRIIKPVAAHAYDKTTKLFLAESKANTKKLSALRVENKWAKVFDNALANDEKKQVEQAEREFNEEKAFASLKRIVSNLAQHGVSHAKILAAVTVAEKKATITA